MHILARFFLLTYAHLVATFNCPQKCLSTLCVDKYTIHSFCKSGVTSDSCGCCLVCAKRADETCGGHLDVFGRCQAGLVCYSNNARNLGKCIQPAKLENITKHLSFIEIAKEPTRKKSEHEISKCKPKCTSSYCHLNPNAICSASENAVVKRTCSGTCQHTSCAVCFLKKTKVTCPKCRLNDFKCIESFASCVRRNSHKKWSKSFKIEDDQNIMCRVPDCPKQ